jgi:hypothetical protein
VALTALLAGIAPGALVAIAGVLIAWWGFMAPVYSFSLERRGDGAVASSTYAALIADILKLELGNSHQAQKTLMRWTGANERTAKNWLSGSNGPSGEHLLQLMRNSDRIFEFVLRLSRRPAVLSNQKLAEIRNSLTVTADLIADVIELQEAKGQCLLTQPERTSKGSGSSVRS